jgi:hypothetical protein
MNKHNSFYTNYIRHLPTVPLSETFEPGGVYHIVYHHDDWCAFCSGKECNCNPDISSHIEPRRS